MLGGASPNRTGDLGRAVGAVKGLIVPYGGQDFFELLVGKFSSLFDVIHGSADFNVDETVGSDFGSKVAVSDDVRREIGIGNVHVLKPV